MSQGSQSCLRFSLEESVWFQKGQEVLDLISISLDPDIFIQEDDQYVTIQGALELSGEYKRNETETVDDEETFAAPKFIQVVEEREEGVCEFKHYFPVDITIPINRIQNLNDIDVQVESFDYIFPERSCMKLSANLMITGLYGEQQPAFEADTQEEEELELLLDRSSVAEDEVDVSPLEKAFAEENEQEEDRTEIFVSSADKNEKQEEFIEKVYIPFEAEARKEPESEPEVKEEVRGDEPEITFYSAKRNEESPPSAEDIFEIPADESPVQDVDMVDVESPEHDAKLESPEIKDESPEKTDKKKKKSKKKSMTLTEFFARKEDADHVAKLKVCIVQSGDTIDQIAERYSIGVHQLLSVNHLEISQDIYEGQVLYIPAVVAR
ncbi:stage VI sporulation protein D [Cytobacillus massiliigabonensis]|uniref:stage VI sporulation protein D n=1 Tax=Cytobacillus massiliigabonensis TaxID=1871011 RepID=UPI000C8668BD|nr:stage VI sporulation protein D [Cytobacillus massiliigabonensis]